MEYIKRIGAILLLFAFVCAICGVVWLFYDSHVLQAVGAVCVTAFAFRPMLRTFIKLAAFAVVLVLCISCHTTNTITDSVSRGTMEHEKVIYKTDIQHDSIYLHDTKNVYLKGDTIVKEVERYKYLYKYIYKHDTINEQTHDTITEYKTIIKSVEKKDNFVHRLLLCVAMVIFLMFFIVLGLFILRQSLKNNTKI